MQEKLSFSDRFGLTLTFEPADQRTYLKIVNQLAKIAGISQPRRFRVPRLQGDSPQWSFRADSTTDFLQAELTISRHTKSNHYSISQRRQVQPAMVKNRLLFGFSCLW